MIFPATNSDIASIKTLWNHYVQNSISTFRSALYSEEEVAQIIEECRAQAWPFLVARNEKLLGFALYRQFRRGDGYLRSMEHSIYLDPAAKGRGIGRKFMDELERRARFQNIHSFVAGVTSDNETSIAFHRACGFRISGQIREIGHKNDRFYDITFMQKFLD